MNLQEFRALASAEDNYEQSEKFIKVYFEDPNYLIQTIQLFSNPEVQNDINLMQLIGIVINRNIKQKWLCANFYSNSLKFEVFRHLNELVYCLPNHVRPNIIDCIMYVIQSEQIEVLEMVNHTMEKFQQQDSVENIVTSLEILNIWASILRLHQKDQVKRGNMFANMVFPVLLAYIKNIQNFNLTYCKPLSIICRIYNNLFSSLDDALNSDFCKEIVGILLSLLSFQSNEEDSIKMKSDIYDLYKTFVQFIKDSPKENEIKRNYLYWFAQNYAIPIYESFFSCINSVLSQQENFIDVLKENIILTAGCMLHKPIIYKTLCENSEMIIKLCEQILIPCCMLTQSDLSDFNDNPTQYLALTLNDYEVSEGCLRQCCSFFALSLKNIVNVIPMLWNYVLTAQDPKVQEACIFLISSCNPSSRFDKNMCEQLFALINSSQYKPLIASILNLISKIKKINVEHAFTLANSILFQTDTVILKLLSIRILKIIIETNPPESFDPTNLIQLTLSLSHEVFHDLPGQFLTSLSQAYPEQILPYSLELIQNIALQFSEAMQYDESEDKMAACTLIESISNLISFQPIEVFSRIFEDLYGFVTSNIIQYKDSAIIETLMDLCWEICHKFDKNPPEQLYQIITLFNRLMDEDMDFIYLLTNFSKIYIYLIPYIKNPEIINQIIIKMNELISEKDQEVSIITRALVILSVIIQSHGQDYLSLIEIGFNVLSRTGLDGYIEMGCIYLFSSALYLNKNIKIPDEIIQSWLEYSISEENEDKFCQSLRDLKINFIGLTILLSQTKSDEIFEISLKILKEISKYDNQPKELPKTEEEEEEEDFNNYDLVPVSDYEVPLESIDIYKLFKDVIQQLSITNIPEEIISILNSK